MASVWQQEEPQGLLQRCVIGQNETRKSGWFHHASAGGRVGVTYCCSGTLRVCCDGEGIEGVVDLVDFGLRDDRVSQEAHEVPVAMGDGRGGSDQSDCVTKLACEEPNPAASDANANIRGSRKSPALKDDFHECYVRSKCTRHRTMAAPMWAASIAGLYA